MGPSHNPTDRDRERDANPLESFVQLVLPQPVPGVSGCGVVATSHSDVGEFEPLQRSDVDSPDDILAEAFPGIDPMQRVVLRGRIEEFVSSIREQVSRSFMPEHEGIEPHERRITIRYAASRRSLESGPIVWVECRCLETGCYVLPRLHEGMCGGSWFQISDAELPERFFEGPARVMLQFDVNSDELVRCFPFVSPLCDGEAERHLMMALRDSEVAEASYLLSQYHELVLERAVLSGDLSAEATQLDRSEYLACRQDPQRIETSSATDGTQSYSVLYGEHQGRPPFVDVISLKQVYPWGLQVSGLTTVRR